MKKQTQDDRDYRQGRSQESYRTSEILIGWGLTMLFIMTIFLIFP
jgi:hypothetical protein